MVFILFVSALLLRVFFLSPWLEDWDSVQFAMGLHDFNVVNHQPHPPGYILYIALGKLLYLFTQNDTLALTSLSAILGSFSIFPFYLLIKKMAPKANAPTLSAIFMIAPLQWNLSLNALSNIPGMAFCLISIYFIHKGKGSSNSLLLGSFLAGITLGVRFAEYTILISLIAFIVLYKKSILLFLKSIIYFLCGVFFWLIPLILDTGLNKFINSYRLEVAYISDHDSIGSLTIHNLSSRFTEISHLFEISLTIYFSLAIGLIIAGIPFYKKRVLNFNSFFVFVWILSYLIPLVFFYSTKLPRDILPLLPPIIIAFGIISQNFSKIIVIPIYIIFITMFFKTGLIQAKQVHSLTPPSIAPVNYVAKHYSLEETIIVSSFTYRQFQYYAPKYKNYWDKAPNKIEESTIIVDSAQLTKNIPNDYTLVNIKQFSGPEEIFPRLPEISLYIFNYH